MNDRIPDAQGHPARVVCRPVDRPVRVRPGRHDPRRGLHRRQLVLKGNTAQWQHFDYGAPGYDDDLPTRINGSSWYPQWSGDPRDCNGCYSGIFSGVSPAISAVTQTVMLNTIQAREDLAIVQQPSAGNDYTLILGFDDNSAGGAAWYVLELEVPFVEATSVSPRPVPSLSEWGMILLMTATAIAGMSAMRRQRTA